MKKILILAIFVLTLFSFSTCFALTEQKIIDIFTYYELPIPEESVINTILDYDEQYAYTTVYYIVNVSSSDGFSFYFTSTPFELVDGKTNEWKWNKWTNSISGGEGVSVNFNRNGSYKGTGGVAVSISSNSNTFLYFQDGSNNLESGWSNVDIPSSSITPDTGGNEDTGNEGISGDFQVTLPAIVQETQPEEVLAEILGLLPIVMVCLVCWIGLRKALKLLSELLKQS